MTPDLPTLLTGRTFLAHSAIGFSLLEDPPVTIAFEAQQIRAHAGCNRLFGPVTWEGQTLHCEQLASTLMACPEPIEAQERAVVTLLGNSPAITLEGSMLTITGMIEGSEVVLMLAEKHDPPLVGTRWVLTGLVKNAGVHSLPVGTSASIEFSGEEGAGAAESVISFGCNTGGGTVALSDSAIDFGFPRMTRKMCPPPQMEVESHMVSVLRGPTLYSLDGERLSITKGEHGLRFHAG